MTEKMPSKSNNNIKLFLIVGIVVISLVIGMIIFLNKGSDDSNVTSLSVDVIAPKKDTKVLSYSPRNSTNIVLSTGSKAKLVYNFNDGKTRNVVWTVSDPTIAKIEGNELTSLKSGKVKVQAVYNGKSVKNLKSNYISLSFK